MYEINNKQVLWNRETIFIAPGDIKNHIEYKDKLIIHYKVANEDRTYFSDDETCRNILCLAFNGEVLWRLQNPSKWMSFPYNMNYQNMGIGSDGIHWAYDGEYSNNFDPKTGEILTREFTK